MPEPFSSSYNQQDASEFFRLYIDCLEHQLKDLDQKELVRNIFVGKVKSTIQCVNGHVSNMIDSYYDLMLNPTNKFQTVDNVNEYSNNSNIDTIST